MNLFLLYIYSIFKDYSSYDIPSKYISGQGIIHHYVGKLEPYSIICVCKHPHSCRFALIKGVFTICSSYFVW